MARINKSRYAILGLLSFGPMSGYDIKKYYDTTIGFFWNENYGQIYPLLKKLHSSEEVTKEVVYQEGKPDRHVYSITEKGLASLKEWMEEDGSPTKLRDELLLKTYFGSITDNENTIRRLEKSMEEHYKQLKAYEDLQENIGKLLEDDPTRPFKMATIRMGKRIAKAKAVWAKETIADLKAFIK